jgi:UDP-2,3-diacylglucosamine hydrolase
MQSSHTKAPIGIFAGAGEMPFRAARNVLSQGDDVRIFHYTNQEVPSDLKEYVRPVVITQMFRSVIRTIKKERVKKIVLLGKAERSILYSNPVFDLRTLWTLAKMKSQSDYQMFSVFADIFHKNGIIILPQDEYLKDMYLKEGRYGKSLSAREIEDIEFGVHYAREMNRLDIGQTIVTGNRSVLAVEAAEGTDKCIERGGGLFRNKGAVVCKVAKSNHDVRFDIPVVGTKTLESLVSSGCRVIAVEASRTFILEPESLLREINKSGITLVALNPENTDKKYLNKLNKKNLI